MLLVPSILVSFQSSSILLPSSWPPRFCLLSLVLFSCSVLSCWKALSTFLPFLPSSSYSNPIPVKPHRNHYRKILWEIWVFNLHNFRIL
ncbi:hypothetical protein BX666DRAFT_2007453 [Dichotomocladium elegans]|nr:hypothetical protein BX666DRAFT_2007453 [Dichotomocladium elegans]